MEVSFSVVVDLIFFSILVGSSLLLFIMLRGYGGSIGKSFGIIGWGALVFGFACILEKFLLQFFGSYGSLISIFKNFLDATALLLILYGFKSFLGK
ncbi:hypothetical protein A2442_03665 [Candidatus Campbellbacteria bacterium RIFOXYC2_FULL_35_25]|uniref:Uncharacterized protein n=1 Tax=Candidatus Campbellbacteria bacterium RIFOXYC2_FULL_35_25 TaxID=1797582 RepID=A0A1F5EJW3_9BACT|nr:MAG: hypothetical protein A2442_03665 [Candidatus Campbellbacteria bacterium RIFOXYC2_FULL_35_25]